jgi:hypothetical protein
MTPKTESTFGTKTKDRGRKITPIILITLLAVIFCFLNATATHAAWYNSNWQYRKKLTIDSTKVGATLSSFPVLVSLTSDSDLAGRARSDGYDILFTSSNGTSKLDHEIEKYTSATGALVAWVRIPSLSNSADTDIYMYYGYSSATNQQNAAGLWSDGGSNYYKGVWHLKESGNGTVGEFKDSTTNANDGTGGGGTSTAVPAQTAGKLGNAQDFDGSNDYVRVADSASFDVGTGNMAISAWVYRHTDANYHGIASHTNGTTSTDGWWFTLFNSADATPDSVNLSMNATDHLSNASIVPLNTWTYFVAVKSGTTVSFYKNGALVNSVNHGQNINNSAGYFRIGMEGSTAGTANFDGLIDEVRFSSAARSSTWISTEYNNQSNPGPGTGSFFKTLGSQEMNSGSSGYNYRKQITIQENQVTCAVDMTNFPVLINITGDDDLRTVGNGGHVQNANGYDITFRAADGTTILDHEVEKYTASTGELVTWVRIPTLDYNDNTVIYMYYGNSTITSPTENPTGVWDSSYKGVWHVHDDLEDSTSNNNDATNNGTSSGTGKIANSRSYNGASYLQVDDNASLNVTSELTMEAWVNLTNASSNQKIVGKTDSPPTRGYLLGVQNGNLYPEIWNSQGTDYTFSSGSFSSSQWTHLAVTWTTGGNMIGYINGSQVNSISAGTYDIGTNTNTLRVGATPWSTPPTQFFTNGLVDEVRICSIARPACWIQTEYNNQNTPSFFYEVGTEQGVGDVSLTEIHYRWRKDNGSEAGAAWLVNEDANITRDKNLNTRLRVLIDATGDPASQQYQLEYKKSTDSMWSKVPTSAPVQDQTIALVGSATGTTVSTATNSPVADLPSGVQSGHLLLAWVVTNGANTLNSITGWTQIGSTLTDTSGDSSQALLYRVATGTEGTSWTFTNLLTSAQTNLIVISAWSGVNTSNPINTSASQAANAQEASISGPSVTPNHDNCMIIQLLGTDPTFSGYSATPDTSPAGNEIYDAKDGGNYGYAAIQYYLQGTQAALGLDYTGLTSDYYGRFQVALNPAAVPAAAISLSASANISASGENTTAQLTPPSGKTTSNFTTGRIQDDENPADAVDIANNYYTELEWCLNATNAAQYGDVYEFRVTLNGVPLTTYSVFPKWTVNAVSDLTQIHYRWRNDDGGESGGSGWWNASWSRRKAITIDNTGYSNALSNYQVQVAVAYDPDMQADFDDIRFTNASGTELDYWMVSKMDSTTATFWVEVDSIAASSNTTIYMYYGNGSVTTTSNAKNTMFIYENMDTAPTGTLRNNASYDAANKWVRLTTAAGGLQGQLEYSTSPAPGFVADWRFWAGGGNGADATWLYYRTSSTPATEDVPTNGYSFPADEWDDQLQVYYNNNTTKLSSWATTTIDNTGWHDVKIVFYQSGANYYYQFWYDSTQRISSNSTNAPSGSLFGWGARTGGYYNEHRIDDLIVRKYISPEPGVSLGTEQPMPTAATWAANEDTKLVGLAEDTIKRVRFEISNEGTVTSGAVTYKLQVAETATCGSGSYTDVITGTGGEWQIVDSTYITDGQATQNIALGLTDEAATFVPGQMKDGGNTTGGITLDADQFTEIEFAVKATSNATENGDYCFRLVSATGTSMSIYTVYAQVSIAGPNLDQIHYRWRNDDGGEGGLDTGTGADGVLAPTGTFNLNTNPSGGRSYADGIAYRIDASNMTANSVTRYSGSVTLSNGIAAGDEVILIDLEGASGDTADVGNYEFLRVQSATASTVTFTTNINNSYDGTTPANQKVLIQRVPNYTGVTLDSTDSVTASAWDGLTTTPTGTAGYYSGLVVFRATGAVSIGSTASISVSAKGYRGGSGGTAGGTNGESYDGIVGSGGEDTSPGTGGGNPGTSGGGGSSNYTLISPTGTRGGGGGGGNCDGNVTTDGAGGAGGGGYGGGGGGGGADDSNGGGTGGTGAITTGVGAGGGGNGVDGSAGGAGGAAGSAGGGTSPVAAAGTGASTGQGGRSENGTANGIGAGGGGGGGTYGNAALTTLFLGSGGGQGGTHDNGPQYGTTGGNGGGIVLIIADTLSVSGTISSNGGTGGASSNRSSASGGGAGGSIMIQANTAALGSSKVTATGGPVGSRSSTGGGGGGGGVGRIRVEADTKSGDTSPAYSGAGTPGGTGASWMATEDTKLDQAIPEKIYRLRFEVSNEGTAGSTAVTYKLQVAQTDTCGSGNYEDVPLGPLDPSDSRPFEIIGSSYLTDGGATTDVTNGLTNESATFVAGQVKDAGNTTGGITLNTNQFTELEFALQARNNVLLGANYCFRLVAASGSSISTYSVYGEIGTSVCQYLYRKPLTIDHSKVTCGSGITDFPVLISLSGVADITTTAYGGHVQSSNGYDIVFRASNGVDELWHEVESYDGSTGTLVAWVKMPTVSATADTTIYMYYGNQCILSPTQNANNVWDSNDYVVVHHMNGSSYTALNDSTGNHNDITYQNGTPAYQQTGKIGYGVSFNGTNGAVEASDSTSLDITNQVTVSAWINPTANGGYPRIAAKSYTSNALPYTIYGLLFDNSGHLRGEIASVGAQHGADGSTVVPTGAWTYATFVYDHSYMRLYFNGAPDGTPVSLASNIDTNTMPLSIARSGYGSDYFNGTIDEVRISNTARPACWIQTEYNNQSSPGTFYTVGAEQGTSYPTAVSLLSFKATGDGGNVLVRWTTAQEVDNFGFHVYRSESVGGPFTRITDRLIPGLSFSVKGRDYSYVDRNVTRGRLYYYKLEDIDFNGNRTMHGPVCVDWDGDGMPDDWEIRYGLDPTANDSGLDLDGDGLSNLQEYYRGTDPLRMDTDGDGVRDSQEEYVGSVTQGLTRGVDVIASDASGMTLELRTEDFESVVLDEGGVSYRRLRVPEYVHGYTEEVGKPELPVKGILIDLPSGKRGSLSVEAVESKELSDYSIYPVPEKVVSGEGEQETVSEVFTIDDAAYRTDSFYPDMVAKAGETYDYRGQKKLQVFFNPFSFNPVTRELIQYTKIRVKVTYVALAEEAPVVKSGVPLTSPPPSSLARSMVWVPPVPASASKMVVSEEGI